MAEEIKNARADVSKFIVVQNSLSFDTPRARIDRSTATAPRRSASRSAEIGNTLSAARRRHADLEVRPRQPGLRRHHARCRRQTRCNPESARHITSWRSQGGSMVPLSPS